MTTNAPKSWLLHCPELVEFMYPFYSESGAAQIRQGQSAIGRAYHQTGKYSTVNTCLQCLSTECASPTVKPVFSGLRRFSPAVATQAIDLPLRNVGEGANLCAMVTVKTTRFPNARRFCCCRSKAFDTVCRVGISAD